MSSSYVECIQLNALSNFVFYLCLGYPMSGADSQSEDKVRNEAIEVIFECRLFLFIKDASNSSENNEPRTPTNVRRVRYDDLSVMTSLKVIIYLQCTHCISTFRTPEISQ